MRKRGLSLIIALVLPIVLLCGCNNQTESDTSLPDSSVVTPEQSTSKPESSVSEPESSASTPESSVSTTESSASKPESSVSKPESSVSKPESSVSKPESSVSKPESSVSKPQSSVSNPQSSANKPESSTSTPVETNAELQKYYDEMIANYYEYTSGSTAGNSPEGCLKTVNAQTAGLKKFAAMTVPKEYADRHSEMMSAADSEQEWRDTMYDYGNGVIDAESFQKKFKELFPTGVNRSVFTTKCLGIIADLNHEAGVVPTKEGQFLEVLSKI